MSRRSTSHPLDAIRRQLGRVRRRHNFREAQRGLYLLVAVGGTAATVGLLLALCGSVRLFAYGGAAVAGLAVLGLFVGPDEDEETEIAGPIVLGDTDRIGEAYGPPRRGISPRGGI